MPKQKTVFSLFCGAGGKTQGAINAGYLPIGAIDYWQPAINAYRQNVSGDAWCKNLLQCDPTSKEFDRPDLLMASPPCPSFSVAKVGGKETFIDQWLSLKVAEFVAVWKPAAVLIENVPPYLGSKSCQMLISNLVRSGYVVQSQILNAADFGAPQTRRRLIILAVDPKKAALMPIVQTHCNWNEKKSAILGLPRWRGWLNAIADLIPDLPDSALTDRQQEAVNQCSVSSVVQRIGYFGKEPKYWAENEPIGTIRASLGADGRGNKREKYLDAYLVSGGWQCCPRSRELPSNTITASSKGRSRAVLNQGAVVKGINSIALQRLQGYPDNWFLGDDCRIAVRLIGNGVVPIVAQAACESIKYI
jgi:DNA (cytosine-5)-methyltransferase 1